MNKEECYLKGSAEIPLFYIRSSPWTVPLLTELYTKISRNSLNLSWETFDSFDFGPIAVNEQSSVKDGRRKFLQILLYPTLECLVCRESKIHCTFDLLYSLSIVKQFKKELPAKRTTEMMYYRFHLSRVHWSKLHF